MIDYNKEFEKISTLVLKILEKRGDGYIHCFLRDLGTHFIDLFIFQFNNFKERENKKEILQNLIIDAYICYFYIFIFNKAKKVIKDYNREFEKISIGVLELLRNRGAKYANKFSEVKISSLVSLLEYKLGRLENIWEVRKEIDLDSLKDLIGYSYLLFVHPIFRKEN